MAIKVKVKRLKLIAKLEAVRDEEAKRHKAAVKKYEVALRRATKAAVKELRETADALERDPEAVRLKGGTEYGGRVDGKETTRRFVQIESKVEIPAKPEPRYEMRFIDRAIRMLDASDDEHVAVSVGDLREYGVGSFTGLED